MHVATTGMESEKPPKSNESQLTSKDSDWPTGAFRRAPWMEGFNVGHRRFAYGPAHGNGILVLAAFLTLQCPSRPENARKRRAVQTMHLICRQAAVSFPLPAPPPALSAQWRHLQAAGKSSLSGVPDPCAAEFGLLVSSRRGCRRCKP